MAIKYENGTMIGAYVFHNGAWYLRAQDIGLSDERMPYGFVPKGSHLNARVERATQFSENGLAGELLPSI